MKQLFVVILSHGATWQPSRALEEQKSWEGHASFMDALVEEGFVVLGGPLESTSEALLVVRAVNKDEVIDRLSGDPWSGLDLLRVKQVAAWRLRLGSLS